MANWHYYNGKGEMLTVTSKELKKLALDGTITPDTEIYTEDHTKSALASKVKGLEFAEPLEIVNEHPDFPNMYIQHGADVRKATPEDFMCTKCKGDYIYIEPDGSEWKERKPGFFGDVEVSGKDHAVYGCLGLICLFSVILFPVGIVLLAIYNYKMYRRKIKRWCNGEVPFEQLRLQCVKCGYIRGVPRVVDKPVPLLENNAL